MATCRACGLVRDVFSRAGYRFFKKVTRGVIPIGTPCPGYKNADIGLRPDGKPRFSLNGPFAMTNEQAARFLEVIFKAGKR